MPTNMTTDGNAYDNVYENLCGNAYGSQKQQTAFGDTRCHILLSCVVCILLCSYIRRHAFTLRCCYVTCHTLFYCVS